MLEKKMREEITNKVEDKLSRETLQTILDNSYDEIFVTDKKGIVIYVNDACERHYGMKPSEVIGKHAMNLSNEGYWAPSMINVVLKQKKRVTVEMETNIGRKLVVTLTPVFDEYGELELVVQNSRDITEIAEIKKSLVETKEMALKYRQEAEELRKEVLKSGDFIAHSKPMRNLLELANKVAPVDSSILLLGESGTGKGVMAKYIHNISRRKEGPFIGINCAAIPDDLLESELFGYAPGSFTGADKNGKIGLIELSNGGTLFLDEIAEIPLRLQAKLLHVLQERKYSPVGGRESKKVDCRIISATNQNLNKWVKEGKFREDLYYRLKVIELEIPALRERIEDILPLLYFFLNRFDRKYSLNHQFSQEALELLIQYSWPGNIRELEHLVERLVITTSDSTIQSQDLPQVFNSSIEERFEIPVTSMVPLEIAIEQIEKKLIITAYKQLGSSYKVAKKLNISQSKACRLIRKYFPEEEKVKINLE